MNAHEAIVLVDLVEIEELEAKIAPDSEAVPLID
jgi:hypothetical protein